MKTLKKIGIIVLILVILVAVGFIAWKLMGGQDGGSNEEVTIDYGLVEIGELATAEYYYTNVLHHDGDAKKFFGHKLKWTTSHFTYSVDGYIKAGIDFAAVEVATDKENRQVIVSLPEVKILDNVIEPDTVKIFDEKNSIFDPINVSTVFESEDEMMKDAEAKAIKLGILDKASENARSMLKAMIESAAPEGYEVVIE